MTSEMAFECLFVSKDPGLFSSVSRILRDLSISINPCVSPTRAVGMLQEGTTDLVVIDWEGEESAELVRNIWRGGKWRIPTVVAISSSASRPPGAHVVVQKPVTIDAGERSFRDAYSRMLVDYRRHVRHALMLPVVATVDDDRALVVTVADIGEGGVGLSTNHAFNVGEVLSFRLPLPGAHREILVHARVLWTRDYGRVGCEFVRLPPVDSMILQDWLKGRVRVKRPLSH